MNFDPLQKHTSKIVLILSGINSDCFAMFFNVICQIETNKKFRWLKNTENEFFWLDFEEHFLQKSANFSYEKTNFSHRQTDVNHGTFFQNSFAQLKC